MKAHHRACGTRVAIVSSNETPWGGSEELWQKTAIALAGQGHRVTVYKPRLAAGSRPVRELAAAGCRLVDLARPLGLPPQLYGYLSMASRLAALVAIGGRLALGLWLRRPDIVLLSQGGNWDGVHFGRILQKLGVPFVIVSQKASEFYWPPDTQRDHLRSFYRAAKRAFFVSRHNLRLTEMQIGEPLPNASVVHNPFLVPYDRPIDWPAAADCVDFACVGRLYPMEKGQDLVLEVLARDTWRDRPVRVTFYGDGVNRAGLEGMARVHRLDNVRFMGLVDDMAAVWASHPALLLASRCEGLPLVVIEAMLAGRVVIASDAGGTAEAFVDNVTGFLAATASVDALDEAMERAWARRGEWQAIGAAAAEAIRSSTPADPGAALAAQIVALAATLDPSGSQSQLVPATPGAD
jgi:glycosyltransferase involved in cell wall biosynthesis